LEELRIFLRMVIGHPPEMGDLMDVFTGQPATVCILSGGSKAATGKLFNWMMVSALG
jgi:hypothetical protein